MVKKISTKDFVKKISKETGYTQKDINAVLEAAESVMISMLKDGDGVKIFKTLSIVPMITPAHTVKLPTTEVIDIPDRITPKAKFSQSLKDFLNDKE